MSSSVNEDDGNGDDICFSSDTLKALNQFYQESAEFNLNLNLQMIWLSESIGDKSVVNFF